MVSLHQQHALNQFIRYVIKMLVALQQILKLVENDWQKDLRSMYKKGTARL